ncbi:MAG: ATP-dependent Clp protease proteolytic subunit, partial [Simkania negevensis]|nr:ATP-dependent Clp protease proteolytic subunit [Simkania negevensis]
MTEEKKIRLEDEEEEKEYEPKGSFNTKIEELLLKKRRIFLSSAVTEVSAK